MAALPVDASFGVLLCLRSLAGSAAGVGGVAGTILAVESTPEWARSRYMFGINFISSFGYLTGAWIIALVMPGFGEEPDDNWRLFNVVMGVVPLLSLPFLFCINESPLFLVVRGNLHGAIGVLEKMAEMNGIPSPPQFDIPARPARQETPLMQRFLDRMAGVSKILSTHTRLMLILSAMDGARSFMTGGSSYLWKDLFHKVDCGPHLNLLASLSPLIGIGIVYFWNDMCSVGTRRIVLACSAIASVGLYLLTIASIQESMIPLVGCIMAVKLTYGPLVTAVNLMKAEAFPSEVRATAFSFISVVAKFACMVAPSLVEELRGRAWSQPNLSRYLFLLCGSSIIVGVLALWVQDGRDQAPHDEMAQGLNSESHFSPPASVQTDAAGSTTQVGGGHDTIQRTGQKK